MAKTLQHHLKFPNVPVLRRSAWRINHATETNRHTEKGSDFVLLHCVPTACPFSLALLMFSFLLGIATQAWSRSRAVVLFVVYTCLSCWSVEPWFFGGMSSLFPEFYWLNSFFLISQRDSAITVIGPIQSERILITNRMPITCGPACACWCSG